MRLSQYFLPLLRENPSEAQIVSHRLMLRAGMIRQSSAGIYSWLPLGLRVLKKVEQIVREEQDRSGAQEILMPTIQPADLWRESGRYEDYGKEMLRIRDRHDREMLYGPTNEEQVTDDRPRRGQELPRPAEKPLPHPVEVPRRGAAALWRHARPRIPDEGQLQLRPRRGRREALLQQDVRRLSAHLRPHGAEGDPDARRYRADRRRSQPRIQILAETGESAVYCDKRLARDRHPRRRTSITTATSSRSSGSGPGSTPPPTRSTSPMPARSRPTQLVTARGIEVGHIFYFGTKYSKPMGAVVAGPGRRGGAARNGLLRHRRVAPGRRADRGQPRRRRHHLAGQRRAVPGRADQSARGRCSAAAHAADDLYGKLRSAGVEVLYDDRDESAGAKFAAMDLIGLPDQLIIGPRGIAAGTVELQEPPHRRARRPPARRRPRPLAARPDPAQSSLSPLREREPVASDGR